MHTDPGFEIFDVSKIDTSKKLLFKSASDFSQYIETVASQNGETVTQALINYCDDRDIDFEQIAPLLTQTMKEKLIYEMAEAGLVRKHSQLEFE